MNQSNYKAYWVPHTVVRGEAAWWARLKVVVRGEMFIHVWINNDSLRCTQSQKSRSIYYARSRVQRRRCFWMSSRYLSRGSIQGGVCMRRGRDREINHSRLIRKEVIVSTSPNITRTLSTPDKTFSPRWLVMSQTVCHLLCGIGVSHFSGVERREWRGIKSSIPFFFFFKPAPSIQPLQ